MKKILVFILVFALICVLLASCGKKNDGKVNDTDGMITDSAQFKVALVTDFGDITDESFNQTAYEASQAFCEEYSVPFNYFKPSGDTTPDRIAMIENAASLGYNVIVLPGYPFAEAIVETIPNYKDVKFIALDVAKEDLLKAAVTKSGKNYDENDTSLMLEDYFDMSNLYCAVYREEISGFLAGYAAVKLGYTKLGFLGGMAAPSVVRFGYGYIQGADRAANELGITVDMKYVYGGQFYGDGDITAVMDTWYKSGTEVVFACGGGIYTSAGEAAQKASGKIIGVDVDQKKSIDAKYGEGTTVTSAMKGLYPSTYATLKDIVVNNNWNKYSGKHEVLGLIGEDVELNYVQLPLNGTAWAEGKFSPDDYQMLVSMIYNGEITVSSDIQKAPAVTNVNVEYLGQIKG